MRTSTLAASIVAGALTLAATVNVLDARQAQQDLALLTATEAPPNAIWIDSLDLSKMVQRRQTPRARQSLAGGRGGRGARGGATGAAGNPIVLGGVTYPHGIGTLSINELIIDLKGQATRFLARSGRSPDTGPIPTCSSSARSAGARTSTTHG